MKGEGELDFEEAKITDFRVQGRLTILRMVLGTEFVHIPPRTVSLVGKSDLSGDS